MKKLVLGLLFSVVSITANAGVINIDTSKWLHLAGPSSDRNTGIWVGLNAQTPKKNGNSSGSLVSDFELFGDFQFSGLFMPTTIEYDDNDIVGVVFGWQDEQNHYRLGWSQTQRPNTDDDRAFTDITGKTGLFLIREVAGVSQSLFNISDLFWDDNFTYSFNIGRSNNDLNFDFGGTVFSVMDSTFSSGRIGVYTESQTAVFSDLRASVPTPPADTLQVVPEPGVVIMYLSGLIMLVAVSRHKRNKAQS
jgi:hypothetical protein